MVAQHADQVASLRASYGVGATVIGSIAPYLPERIEPPYSPPTVVWLGGLRTLKRPELFLAMARHFPKARFVMMGGPVGSDTDCYAKTEAEARTLSNVEFLGLTADPSPRLARAWVLLNTSVLEGYPSSFLEAWGHGVPTVSFVDPGERCARKVSGGWWRTLGSSPRFWGKCWTRPRSATKWVLARAPTSNGSMARMRWPLAMRRYSPRPRKRAEGPDEPSRRPESIEIKWSMSVIYASNDMFTKHFLDERLRRWPEWAAALEAATEARARLISLLSAERDNLPALKEKQLEYRWVQPVLQILGVAFEVGPALPAIGGTVEPDYALFASPQEMREAEAAGSAGGAPAYFDRVRVLGDAKRWGTNFAASSGGRSPIQQIAEYLAYSGVDWGWLTDGRRWRLVHRSQASRWDQYYEVDLPNCLESESLDDFLYFYLFFSGDALRRHADGRCFLDAARRESREYAEAVGRGLKDSVYEALRRLGCGFLARVEPGRPIEAELLRRESLVLLYRLLFLLYAEHRRLLPIEDARYRDGYSFTGLTREIAAHMNGGTAFSSRGSTLWGRLKAIFEIVDHGDPDLGVPAYNGGLFSSEKHPLLARTGPGDADLAAAIDLLARTATESRHFIDYRDLEIRHLGTIYEGLLEYRLEIASTDLAVVAAAKGKGERYEPFDPARHSGLPVEMRVAAGDAYLVTDRGERKGTGSFYTPDFVVEHVVAETLGPLVAGKRPGEILKLRVLDPAMGSGHFLLEATDYLARAYGQARIVAGEDEDGILSENELTEYRRLIAETCIYGVDLNPMAVELAKLALWLRTMAGEQA